MVKLSGPLFSTGAHGKLAKNLIYSRQKTGNIVRPFHMPDKTVSLKQWTQRHIIGLLTAHWQVMTDGEKAVWNVKGAAEIPTLPGFAKFIKDASADLYTHHGLCGYWSMNEETGNTAYDYSGQKNHGTLMPTYPSNCPTRIDAMRKEYGKALQFDGVNDYLSVGDKPILSFTNNIFTFEFWMKASSTPSLIGVLGKRGSPWEYGIFTLTAGTMNFSAWNTGGASVYSTSASYTPTWTHFAWSANGTNAKLYKNSALVSTAAKSAYVMGNTDMPFLIGASGSASGIRFFNGLIDEVRVYNRALGAAEIKKHYNLLRLDKKRQPLLIH